MFSARGFAAGVFLLGISSILQAAPAEEMKSLVEQGRPAEAYSIGAKSPELLGQPGFDYFFGVAAIDSGHAGEGVLALERYILNFPENPAARLELARGYFVLGDDARARDEFERVTKTRPPADVQANIDRFIDAIRSRESLYSTTAGFYVEAGYGYDSNVSGGVSNGIINFPGFLINLNGTSAVKAGSSYSWLAAGGQFSKPIAPGLAVFGSGQVDGKFNNANNQFDQNNVAVAGGLSYLQNKNFYRATLSHSEVAVDDTRYRETDSISAEWHRQLDGLQTISPFAQYAQLRYTANNQSRDADLFAAGLGYRKTFLGSWQPLVSVNLNGGQEHDIRGRPDLGRELYGGRLGFSVTPAPKWAVSLGATYLHSHYQGPDVLLAIVRKDNYVAADATVSYAYTRNLSVRVELLGSKNSSNLDLYAYRRDIAALKVRYDFK
jgi:hypothetical protein